MTDQNQGADDEPENAAEAGEPVPYDDGSADYGADSIKV
ncbi:MAG: hypothetical protein JWR84_144, partial [Caulobacter sp.]|nr:hypothetical protein [Caulobacter sp.]